ncbi:MAG TPA: hypothetical protein VI670_05365 [Thermoanaerobaculia bacterium]
MIVVADTSPLLYLILLGHEQVLPALYERVIAPRAVISELSHAGTPQAVRDWAASALLIDDQEGREEAIRRHLPVFGTLRVLAAAADAELIDLPKTVARLRQTSFRASEELFKWVLSRRPDE